MTTKALGCTLFAAGLMLGLSWIVWMKTTPGVVTATEFHILLIIGAPCLIMTLCAVWIGEGRPPVDTRGDERTHGDNRRVIKPPGHYQP